MSMNTNRTRSLKNATDKRVSDLKLFSFGSIVILLAIILVLNILLYVTLNSTLNIDTSSTSQNTISDVSYEYLKSLPSNTKVRIVGLFTRPTTLKDTAYEYIVPLLDDLEEKSDGKVTVEYVDPNVQPSIINEIDPDSVTDIRSGNRLYQYAVCCDGKIRFVNPQADCFNFDADRWLYYEEYLPISNKTESAFINTIINVTSQSAEKAYFLTGIQEDSSHSTITSILASMNIESVELDVNSADFKIPEDCSILFILCPDVDISENVQEAIKDYINNTTHPCNIVVSLGIDKENISEDYTHLNNVLHEVNLEIKNNNVFDEDSDYNVDPDNGFFKANLTGSFANNNSTGLVFYRLARNIEAYNSTNTNYVTEPIALTSYYVSLIDLQEFDDEGKNKETVSNEPVNIGMVSYSEGTSNQVNVFVFGSNLFTSDSFFSNRSSNDDNYQFMRSLLGNVFSTHEHVDVPVKSLLTYYIDMSKVNQNSVGAISIIFMIAIPLVFVSLAWIVYYRRSHL